MSLPEKIEKLVYSGMVIDDHGKWISIAEKLRKEKKFLSHLERGEILIDGKWTRLNDSAKTKTTPPGYHDNKVDEATVLEETTLDPPESPEETVYLTVDAGQSNNEQPSTPEETNVADLFIPTSEETVAVSTDTIRDLNLEAPDSGPNDPVEPPETQSLLVESIPAPPDTTQSLMTEFEETVLYNIKVLKETSPAADLTPPPRATEHDPVSPDYPLLKNPPPAGTILIVIAAIIIIALIVFKLFFW